MNPTPEQYLARAVELAAGNVDAQGGPFAALVVTLEGRVFDGVNRVTHDHDPTAHAEVVAIREACRQLGTFDLHGSTLYASCEPCPMCLGAALWAHVDRVYFAADRHDAARAGFDDEVLYEFIQGRGDADRMALTQLRVPTAGEPFRRWNALATRIEY